jgi:uncharacterized protein (DUF433 family)
MIILKCIEIHPKDCIGKIIFKGLRFYYFSLLSDIKNISACEKILVHAKFNVHK